MTDEEALARHIATELSLTLRRQVFTGPVRPVAENQTTPGAVRAGAVFCLGTGGLQDIPFVDGGQGGAERRPTVQVFVRSTPDDYDAGRKLADDVFSAVDKSPPAGYFDCRASGSAPFYVGKDDEGHHEWSINVLLKQQV